MSGMFVDIIANEKKREKRLIEQGREQGREQERIETAKRLLEMGISVEQAAKGTNLSIDEVRKIKMGIKQ